MSSDIDGVRLARVDPEPVSVRDPATFEVMDAPPAAVLVNARVPVAEVEAPTVAVPAKVRLPEIGGATHCVAPAKDNAPAADADPCAVTDPLRVRSPAFDDAGIELLFAVAALPRVMEPVAITGAVAVDDPPRVTLPEAEAWMTGATTDPLSVSWPVIPDEPLAVLELDKAKEPAAATDAPEVAAPIRDRDPVAAPRP
jgi:hypothetical protein